jgi:hypothetical protein
MLSPFTIWDFDISGLSNRSSGKSTDFEAVLWGLISTFCLEL